MKYLIVAFLIVFLGGVLNAQTTSETQTGRVSYISSQNIYVKFESTKNISIGDTLFLLQDQVLIPVLLISNYSSTSCVCSLISSIGLTVNSQIISKNKVKPTIKKNEVLAKKEVISQTPNVISDTTSGKKEKQREFKQKINGSISASSYSNFSNTSVVSSNRFQYNLTLDALNINDSRFSLETYISFRYNQNEWNQVKKDVFHALKIYSLSFKYDINKTTQVSFGRKINPKISSLGAVDGFQFEKKINKFSIGAILGSKPNYTDYSLDLNLPQFGAYVAHTYKTTNGEMQNTFALINQMNASKTDRRFAYFQHSNSIVKNLYLFGAIELDLYKKVDSKAQNTISLTSSFLSLNYRVMKRLSISTSYDIRKNVIYYETYKSFINQLLENEASKGLNFQTNYNSFKKTYFGIRTGYRFPNNNSIASKNIYGYFTFSRIPILNISTTVAATWLQSSYLSGNIMYLNISRELFKGKIFADCGYQLVDYRFAGVQTPLKQNIANISLYWRVFKKLSLSLNFEETFEKNDRYSRLNLQIRQRF